MYDDILIPTDGSDVAAKGAEHGVELAASVDATVHALYVINLPGTPRTVYVDVKNEDEIREKYETYGQEVTGDVCDLAGEAGVECVSALRSGTVHEEIVDYAESEGMDVIVIGTGYRGKIGTLFGSTAEKVVRGTEVPVLSIRRGEYE